MGIEWRSLPTQVMPYGAKLDTVHVYEVVEKRAVLFVARLLLLLRLFAVAVKVTCHRSTRTVQYSDGLLNPRRKLLQMWSKVADKLRY